MENTDIDSVATTVDHNELNTLLHHYNNVGEQPLMVWGPTGIGKSAEVKSVSEEIAEETSNKNSYDTVVNFHDLEQERQEKLLENIRNGDNNKLVYIEWNEVNPEIKDTIMENPEDFYVLIDIRLSQYEASDIKGVPDLDGEAVRWKPPLWVKHIAQDEAQGTLFLDEINLAPTTVQNASYQIVLDRQIGEFSISDKVHMVAAGNRAKDKAKVYDMPAPLRDRFRHVELEIPTGGEVQKDDKGNIIRGTMTNHAIENDWSEKVIGFLTSPLGETEVFTFYKNKDNKAFATPRTWESISDAVADIPVTDHGLSKMRTIIASQAGRDVADKFHGYMKTRQKVNIEKILENPEEESHRIKQLENDEKYSVITAIASRYQDQKDGELVDKLCKIADNLEPEYGILMLRIAKRYHEDHFTDHLVDSELWDEQHDEYADYLID